MRLLTVCVLFTLLAIIIALPSNGGKTGMVKKGPEGKKNGLKHHSGKSSDSSEENKKSKSKECKNQTEQNDKKGKKSKSGW